MKKYFVKIVAVSLFVFVGAAGASSLQNAVEELMKARKYNTGGMGVVFRDLDKDSIVVSVNPDMMMNPASVQKLVTCAAALELLGPTYTFATRVFIDGEFQADSGIVNGNLYIKGTGDPGLNVEKIWLLVQHLRHRGIRRVTGELVIDNTFFDNVGVGPGFSEEESRSYQSLISALAPNFSSIAIHHRPGHAVGSPVHVDFMPKIDGVRVNSTATTVDGKKGRIDVSTSLDKGTTVITVKGTMGIEEAPTYTYRRMWQTWESFGGAVRAQCKDNGITIVGKTVQRKVPDTLEAKGAFYRFGGEPLTEFTRHSFKWSSNFVTEMLFKTMGAVKMGEPGTWPKGVAVVSEWWTSRGFSGNPVIINGSGMGGIVNSGGRRSGRSKKQQPAADSAATPSSARVENLISAGQIVELLTYVSKQKNYYPDFVASLPVSGVDGTLRSRFVRSKLRGVVRGKTGTLNSLKVSALAGYLLLDDKTYAFAIFCNNVGKDQFDNWVMQEQILEAVAGVDKWK